MDEKNLPDNIRVLKNGAHYDMEKKRIVATPNGGLKPITKENAHDFHEKRRQAKRKRIADSANKWLASQGYKLSEKDDMLFVEIIVGALMEKALDSSNSKQVEAVKFLLKEAGLSEDAYNHVSQGGQSSTSVLEKLGSAMVEHILNRSKE